MRFDAVLWDVDGTLLDFKYSQRISLCKCLEEIGIAPTDELVERYDKINESWWQRLERGEVSKEKLLTGRFYDFFENCGIQTGDVLTFQNHYEENLGQVYQYRDNSLEVCRALKGKCLQFVVTNGVAATQMQKLKAAGFFSVMDNVFISEQVGVPKPQRAFFDRVFEAIPTVERDRVLIVGDSLSSDMRGGNNAGIVCCWYNPTGEVNHTEVKTDYMIKHLREVIPIVEG